MGINNESRVEQDTSFRHAPTDSNKFLKKQNLLHIVCAHSWKSFAYSLDMWSNAGHCMILSTCGVHLPDHSSFFQKWDSDSFKN